MDLIQALIGHFKCESFHGVRNESAEMLRWTDRSRSGAGLEPELGHSSQYAAVLMRPTETDDRLATNQPGLLPVD